MVAGGDRHGADQALVAALASGMTVKDAAVKAGVSDRTARRRLEDTEFRRRVADARSALLERAVARLADATTEAADTLRGLLRSESDSVKHAAAKTLFDLTMRGIEMIHINERVAALEQAAEAAGLSAPGRQL